MPIAVLNLPLYRRAPHRRSSSTGSAFPSSRRSSPDSAPDLPLVKAYCQSALERCTDHEAHIARLQVRPHPPSPSSTYASPGSPALALKPQQQIDSKLSQWDSMLHDLAETEARARTLGQQVAASLHTLQLSTRPHLVNARNAVEKSQERVKGSRATLESATAAIEDARQALTALEARLAEEEATLRKIDSWQQALLWIALAVLALISILCAWFFARA
ncbi:hypothetical protein JCM21900_003651 [Sporobolomyces salmonicolor]